MDLYIPVHFINKLNILKLLWMLKKDKEINIFVI